MGNSEGGMYTTDDMLKWPQTYLIGLFGMNRRTSLIVAYKLVRQTRFPWLYAKSMVVLGIATGMRAA